MADYGKIAREAASRRKVLRKELARAEKSVAECGRELEIVDQILGALRGVRGGGAGSAIRAGKKPGKWRLGKPGRPPKWWVEQQEARGKGGRKAKAGRRKARRGRKPGRKPAAPRPAPAPAAPASS